jgi:hypothetical protein
MYVYVCMLVMTKNPSTRLLYVCMYTSSNEQNVHQDTGLINVGRLGWFDCMYVCICMQSIILYLMSSCCANS